MENVHQINRRVESFKKILDSTLLTLCLLAMTLEGEQSEQSLAGVKRKLDNIIENHHQKMGQERLTYLEDKK